MINHSDINPANLPIFKKGIEIYETVDHICELFPEDNIALQAIEENIMEDASTLFVKIAGAQDAPYDLRMEAATLIRKSANNLMVQNHALGLFGFKDVEYFKIVRDLIEEYRLLFIDWVASFDPWDYVIDRWGLFNPPGVGPFDKDPDDDIPFDPKDFFEEDTD